jgi:hypothetical protein
MYCKCLYALYVNSLKYMHSFLIEKFGLDFIENKFLITSLYLHEMLNSVISLQIMLFGPYKIDKSSLEHHNIKSLRYRIFKLVMCNLQATPEACYKYSCNSGLPCPLTLF